MAFLASIIPTIGVSFLFWLAIRAMLAADRNERAALARADRAESEHRENEVRGSVDE